MSLRAVYRVLACVLIAASPVFGGERGGERRLDARLKLLYRAQAPDPAAVSPPGGPDWARALVDRLQAAPRRGHAPARLTLLVKHEGDRRDLERAGFRVRAQVGAIYAGSLPPGRLAALADLPGVRFVQPSQELSAASAPASASLASPALGGGPAPQAAGAPGVIVAFIDTGVDIWHQDFRKADGTTRIRALLDLSDPGDLDGDGDLDGAGPSGGTLYTEAEINDALDLLATVRQKDTTGHGTHGLSVAAGDAGGAPGPASAADLVVVKATRENGSLGFASADVIAALAFVDAKAIELGAPYVVNLSLGTIYGSHDGRSLEEQAIDALFGPGRPGKVAVVAAGNSSENRSARYHHARGTSYVGLSSAHTLTVPSFTPLPGQGDDRILLDAWYEGGDRIAVTVTPPGGTPLTAGYGEYVETATPQGSVFIANLGGASPENGDTEAIVLVDDWDGIAPATGDWTIAFTGEGIESTGEYHLWLADESTVGGLPPYLSANADNAFLVGKPGGAVHAITVGSYAAHDPATRFRTLWTDVNALARADATAVCDLGEPPDPVSSCAGDISDFSSPGRTRDGRIKPDVAAPGERVLGAVSRDAMPGVAPASIYRYHGFEEPDALLTDASSDEAFGVLQGTSFAAPVVTGLAARILSEDPTLDAVQVRNVLVNSVLPPDAYTGPLPNDEWGYGRVDLAAGLSTPLPPNLRIEDESVPGALVGRPFSHVFTASGGALPFVWSVTPDPPAPGLLLDSRGFLSGTPTVAGSHVFTVQVSDATPSPQVASREFTLQVEATGTLHVITEALPPATLGRVYDEALEAAAGTGPYTWSLAGGELPAGLSLTAEGHVQGTPTLLGRYSFTVQVEDAAAATAVRSVRLKVTRFGTDDWDPLGVFATEITQIVVDPGNPSHVFSTTANVGDEAQDAVFESTDAGESWAPISINNGFNNTAIALALSPSSTLWAIRHTSPLTLMRYDGALGWTDTDPCEGSGNLDALAFDPAGGVYVMGNCVSSGALRGSTDDGATWSTVGSLCRSTMTGYSGSLSISPVDPDVMYATRDGLESYSGMSVTCGSQDGGATWTQLGEALVNDTYLDVQVSSTDPLDVVRAVDIFPTIYVERSTDGGATWTRSYVPASPFLAVLRRAPSDPSVLLLGTSSTLAKSDDHGLTWTVLSVKGRSMIDVNSLAFDPLNADKFYVGSTAGLFYTADGGDTWALRNRGLVRDGLAGLAISPSAPDELLLATTGGAPYLTRTGGERWARVDTSSELIDPVISAADPALYLAGSGMSGLYRSDNHGLTWVPSGPSCTFCWSVQSVAADPFDANVIIVGVTGHEAYRSTDRGATWTLVGWTDVFAQTGDIDFAMDVPGRVWAALTLPGLHRSDDHGATWTVELDTTVHVVEPAPSDSRYVYAAGATIHRRDPDTGTWSEATTSPPGGVLDIAVEWTDPLVAYAGRMHPGTAGDHGGLYKTIDGGQNWTHVPGPLDAFSVVALVTHPTSPGTVVAATLEGGPFRSTDFGVTWRAINRYGSIAELVNVHLLEPGGTAQYAATEGYGVQKSTDGGSSFTPMVSGLGSLNVHAIAFDPQVSSTLYAGTDAGLYKSTDGAATWTATGQPGGKITDVVTHNEGSTRRIWVTVAGEGVAYSADGGATFQLHATGLSSLELTSLELETIGTTRRIWVTTHGGDGLLFSEDDGLTWRSAAGAGLTSRNVNDFTWENSSTRRIWVTTRRIWVTTDLGVFYSDNDGLSWSGLSLGLPSGVPVSSIAIDPNTNEAMVSLLSDREGGVYRGGNVTGVWSAFSEGLDELQVRRLTHDRQTLQSPPVTAATQFFAATAGDGSYENVVAAVAGSALAITTGGLPGATLHAPYAGALAASGGTPPYVWSVQEGFLPPGLALAAASGVLSGTPSQLGTYTFDVQVADTGQRIERKSFSVLVTSAGIPDLAVADVSVVEGNAGPVEAVFTVTLSGTTGADVTVDYATVNGSAAAGADYTLTQGALIIPAGEMQATVAVPVAGDTAGESDETFLVVLANVLNAHVADHQAVGTIVDDDQPRLTIGDAAVVEGDAGTVQAVFAVSLSGSTTETVTVDYATADGTAVSSGADTVANTAAITIPDAANASPYPSPITISTPGQVSGITVTLSGLSHVFVDDVDVLVVGPSGQSVILMSDVGGSASGVTLTFDDAAPSTLAYGSVVTGTYRPTNFGTGDVFGPPAPGGPYGSTLSAFEGTTAAGDWHLYVRDDLPGGSGAFAGGWSLSIQTTGDYEATAGTLTFPAGTTSQPISVAVRGDDVSEVHETFSVALANAVQANLDDATGTGTIQDDDGPSLSIDDVSVPEGAAGTTDAVFTVSLGPGALPVTVDYATSAGSASAGLDFEAANGTLSFPASGSPRSQTITVAILGDTGCEGDETFSVQLTNASGADLTDGTGTATIQDDEALTQVSIGPASAAEGGGSAAFAIALDPPPGDVLEVGYATADGTAQSGADYVAASGALTFAAGSTGGTLEVAVSDDALDEDDETFTVGLSAGACSSVTGGPGVATIGDDDPLPTLAIGDVVLLEGRNGLTPAALAVSLSAPSGRSVEVHFTAVDGTAIAGIDYNTASGTLTFAPGETSRTATVWVNGDATPEDDEGFTVQLSDAAAADIADGAGVVTILDDDTPRVSVADAVVAEGDSGLTGAVFAVTLRAPAAQAVTVGYRTTWPGAAALGDYQGVSGRVTLPPGSVNVPIAVQVRGDLRDEADETFTVRLLPAPGLVLDDGTAIGTIVDDDPPPAVLIPDASVMEGDTSSARATFRVALSTSSGRVVTVPWTVVEGTATAGADYVAASGTLTFAPGATRQPVTVTVIGDDVEEPGETFQVVLGAPQHATLADAEAVGTIVDDDAASTPGVTIADATVAEGDAGTVQAVFTVTLSAPASVATSVAFRTIAGTAGVGDYVHATGTLLFPPGTTSLAVTVAVRGDLRDEADETFLVKLVAPTSLTILDGTATGTIVDDDP